jgi:hypothetical protein
MNQAVMDILSRTSGTAAGSPYDAMMQAAAAEAAAKAVSKKKKKKKKKTRGSQSGFLPASRTVMTPHLAEFGNRRLPVSSLKPEFIPTAASVSAEQAAAAYATHHGQDMSHMATLPDMLIEPTIDEQVELFDPSPTTDWKKYWPLAAAGVGVIGLIFLLRRRKKG